MHICICICISLPPLSIHPSIHTSSIHPSNQPNHPPISTYPTTQTRPFVRSSVRQSVRPSVRSSFGHITTSKLCMSIGSTHMLAPCLINSVYLQLFTLSNYGNHYLPTAKKPPLTPPNVDIATDRGIIQATDGMTALAHV